jgi:hypothetical protein
MVEYFIAGFQVTLNFDEIPDSLSSTNVDPLSATIVIADHEDALGGAYNASWRYE